MAHLDIAAPAAERVSSRPRALAPGLLLHAVWLLPCLLIVAWFFSAQFRGLYVVDAVDAAQVGRHLSRGDGYVTSFLRPLSLGLVPKAVGHPDLLNAPLYPLMLAIAFNLFGATDRTVALVASLFGLLTAVVAYAIASRLAGRWAGAFAALLVAVNMAILKAGVAGIGIPMLAFAVALLFYVILLHRGTLRWSALCGAVCGLAYLTDASALLLAVPGAALVGLGQRAARARHVAGFLMGFALLLSPWMLRNWAVTGSPVGSLRWYAVAGHSPANPGTSLYRVAEPSRVAPVRALTSRPGEVVKKTLTGLGAFEGVVGTDFGIYLWALLALALFTDLGTLGNRLKWGAVAGGLLVATSVVAGMPRFEVFYALVGLAAGLGAVAFTAAARQRHFTRRTTTAAALAVLALPVYPLALLALPGARPPQVDHKNLEYVGRILPAGTVVLTDQPWGVAWYADRPAVWLPEAVLPTPQIDQQHVPTPAQVEEQVRELADVTRARGYTALDKAGISPGAIYLSSDLRGYATGERLERWQWLQTIVSREVQTSQESGKAAPVWTPPGWELAAALPPGDFLLLRKSGGATR